MKLLNSIEVWEYPDEKAMQFHCNEMEKDGYEVRMMAHYDHSITVTYQKGNGNYGSNLL